MKSPRQIDCWRDRLLCGTLISVYLLWGWFYWRPIVPLAKPDEALHLVYVADIRQGTLWPQMHTPLEPPFVMDERCQPPLYYWLTALLSGSGPLRLPGEWITENPFFCSSPGNGGRYLALAGDAAVVAMLRYLSLLWGVIGLCGVHLGARAWRGRGTATLAALAAATLPTALFVQTAINNTALLVAFNALALAEFSWAWTDGLTPRRARRLALLLPLAIYTRLEGLILLVPLTLLLGRELVRRRLSRPVLIPLLIGGLACAPLFIHNVLLYHDPLASACLTLRPTPLTLTAWWQGEAAGFARAILVTLGECYVFASDGIYYAIAVVLLLGFLGWLRKGARPTVAWGLLSYTVALVALTVQGTLRYIAGGPRYIGTYGAAWLTLWAVGWVRLWPRAGRRLAAAGGVLLCWALSMAVILHLLIPVYVPPAAAVRAGSPVAQFDEGIILQSATVAPVTPHPGDAVTVQLTWQATRPVSQNYVVFVHVVPADAEQPIAQRDTHPFNGNYPTSWWQPGRPFVDTYRLTLPPETQGPFTITVGLYRFETQARLAAADVAGVRFRNDAVPVAVLTVTP